MQTATLHPKIFYANFQAYGNAIPTSHFAQNGQLKGCFTKANTPWLNFIWGEAPNKDNFEQAKVLSENRPFCWLIKSEDVLPEGINLEIIANFPVMGRLVADDAGISQKPEIQIRTLDQEADLTNVMGIFAKSFNIPLKEVQSMPPRPTPGKLDVFIASYEGIEAAISISCMASETIGIYYMAVLPEFRRKGLCRALIDYSLKLGQDYGAKQAVLLSSPEGALAYETMGFEVLENPIGAIWIPSNSSKEALNYSAL